VTRHNGVKFFLPKLVVRSPGLRKHLRRDRTPKRNPLHCSCVAALFSVSVSVSVSVAVSVAVAVAVAVSIPIPMPVPVHVPVPVSVSAAVAVCVPVSVAMCIGVSVPLCVRVCMCCEQFLEIARKSLMDEFRELRGCASDNLLYIKEDLIIPHDMTFHYLIETKARCVRWGSGVLIDAGLSLCPHMRTSPLTRCVPRATAANLGRSFTLTCTRTCGLSTTRASRRMSRMQVSPHLP